MPKFCVWRTHATLSEAQEKPSASFYPSRVAAQSVADKWRERDQREINSYASPDDHHIPIIQDRRHCVRGCDERDEFCACYDFIQEHYNGNTECVETPADSWDDPDEAAPPKKRFFGLF